MPRLSDVEIRCPACATGSLRGDGGGEVVCSACSRSYPQVEGVINLLAGEAVKPSLAQRSMEFEPIVRIYESWFWRRSPFVALFLGVSFDRELALILGAADLKGMERVLDLACGPGIYTRPFARALPAGCVVGLDLSLPMLQFASRRAHQEGIENVVLIRGTALNLPFPTGHFDVVNCCGALHLFPDVPRALDEVHRVLKSGGRFTVATFRRSEGRVAATRADARRKLSGLNAFSPRELESRLGIAGLNGVRVHHSNRAWLVVSARKADEATIGA